MEAELQSLEENHIFDVIINDVNQKVLQGRWVFKLKRGPKAEILRYKSRWIVCGFEQKYGIDYEDTFAADEIWRTIRTHQRSRSADSLDGCQDGVPIWRH